MRKKDYENELRKISGVLAKRDTHDPDMLDEIAHAMPVTDMKDPVRMARFVNEKNLSLADSLSILAWIFSMKDFLTDIRVSSDVTIGETTRRFEEVRVGLLFIHRLNYILYESMVRVFDILEKEDRLAFAVKKYYNIIERRWEKHESDKCRVMEKSAWSTMEDHLRISSEVVRPFLEKVYESLRDYMIRLGWRDIEVKANCQTVFLMGKVMGHSFRHYFRCVEKECGVDFSKCFSEDEVYDMVGQFSLLCNSLGIRTAKDEHGYWMLADFDPEKNLRFMWAWDDLMKTLRNDDLMDDAARKAIDLNPEVQREYSQILAEEEKKAMDNGIEQLSSKYKIGNL